MLFTEIENVFDEVGADKRVGKMCEKEVWGGSKSCYL
jgi:hypothetical protein